MKELSSNDLSDDEYSDIYVPLQFLERSKLWDTVKPYNFHYFPKQVFPLHNVQKSAHEVRVQNMRPMASTLSLDVQGFELHRLSTKLDYSSFLDDDLIQRVYFKELEDHLQITLQARKVRALDFQLRIKDPDFPFFGGKPHPKPQPSLLTHVDVTSNAAQDIVREIYGESAARIMDSRFQIITVWRPLKVPVLDWPLALCDASTVDDADLVASDVIYPNYVAENRLMHFNNNQRWYWLPDQTLDEILVFKAVDSENCKDFPCPHGAFPLPSQGKSGPLRASIDVRLLVMYADIEYPDPKDWGT